MKFSVPFLLLASSIFYCSCSNPSSSSIENAPLVDSVLLTDTQEANVAEDTSLSSFLSNPFDLIKFKQKKGSANSTIVNGNSYLFKPKVEGSYWSYTAFEGKKSAYYGEYTDSFVFQSNQDLEIIVFKRDGQYQHVYDDPTEQLIQVKALVNYKDLPELAFVGLSKSSIEARLGAPDYFYKDCLVYQYNNNVLVLHCHMVNVDGHVDWLRYVRLKEGLRSIEIEGLFKW